LVIPAGTYRTGPDGALIPGTYHRVPSPLSFGDKVQQLILSPVNGLYGLRNPITGFVDTQTAGSMFGSVGVVLFIMSIGAFISVSFATRSLEVAIAGVAAKLQTRGWLLIAAIMTLLSLLGTTMGFSVETLGFYALFIPLMSALGYDRLVTAAMIIIGALTGVMAATVNPFSIGVAAGESGVSIGDGILLRVGLWVLLPPSRSSTFCATQRRCAETRADRWSASTSPPSRRAAAPPPTCPTPCPQPRNGFSASPLPSSR